MKSDNDVDLTEHQLRRVRLNLNGLPYVGPGRYRFRTELKDSDQWRVVADLPLRFEVQSPRGIEGAPASEPTV